LAAAFFSMLITLLLIEAIFRVIPAPTPYRVPRALFRTCEMPLNSLRYHDYEYPAHKPPHTYRILVVGDSFSACGAVNVDDGYPKRLEHYLNRFWNKSVTSYQVMNLSKPGRSTPGEVGLAITQALRFKVDMIIVGYCLNDPEDWENRDYLKKLQKKCIYQFFEKPEGWRGMLYTRSALAKIVMQRIFNTRAYRAHMKYYRKLYRDDYSGWQKSQKALQELGDFAIAHHIKAGVLIFPLLSYGLGDDYPFIEIHEKLYRAITRAGLEYLDLLPYFKYQDPICLEYLPNKDPHPNEVAYRIAAEALWIKLKGYGDLPPIDMKHIPQGIFPKKPPNE